MLGRFFTKLGNPCFNAGNVTAQRAKTARFLQLSAGLLQAQVENFLPHVPAVRQQFRQRLILKFFSLILLHVAIQLTLRRGGGK